MHTPPSNQNRHVSTPTTTIGSTVSTVSTSTHPTSSLSRIRQYEERYKVSTTNNSSNSNTSSTRHSIISNFECDEIVPALALQRYYLPYPNQTWWDDYKQYYYNNHPLFGICCHHRLHPVGIRIRLWTLFGSIMFGICLTNIMWLWFYYYNNDDEYSFNNPILIINLRKDWSGSSKYNNDTTTTSFTDDDVPMNLWNQWKTNMKQYHEIRITNGMMLLWTLGGLCHGIYDSTIWHLDACLCCLRKDYIRNPTNPNQDINSWRKAGRYIVITSTLLLTAIASLIVVLRASLHSKEKQIRNDYEFLANIASIHNYNISTILGPTILDDVINDKQPTASDYNFLLSYVIEFVLAMIIYYPFTVAIFFSGILGCGSIPILGGRPYDIAKYRRRQLKKQRQQQLQEQQQQQQQQYHGTSSTSELSPLAYTSNHDHTTTTSHSDLER